MQINRNKKQLLSRKNLIIGLVILVAAILVLFVYLYMLKGSMFGWNPFLQSSSSSVNYQPPSKEEKQAGEDAKHNTISNNPQGSNKTEKTPTNSTTPPPTTTPSSVELTITHAIQNRSTLEVGTLIDKVTSNGQCTLTLARAGQASITQTANIQSSANSSTCKGFSIPTDGLASGSWALSVAYKDGSITGSASQTVMIN